MPTDWDQLKEVLNKLLNGDPKQLELEHRLQLARFWKVKPGDHVLEIGSGQGVASAVLATFVGPSGRIVAIDNASESYGSPMTLRESHAFIKSFNIGERIEFLTSTNLLHHQVEFSVKQFDVAVFCHSSWYTASLEELQALFCRARRLARCLAYAEWDLRPQQCGQVPHMLAALLQAHVQAIHLERTGQLNESGNIRTVILPEEARKAAENAGWTVGEEAAVPSSTPLRNGKSEIRRAIHMAAEIEESLSAASSALRVIRAERQLLSCMPGEIHISLPTYAFNAH
jgi:hypothetical protein